MSLHYNCEHAIKTMSNPGRTSRICVCALHNTFTLLIFNKANSRELIMKYLSKVPFTSLCIVRPVNPRILAETEGFMRQQRAVELLY